MILLNVHAGEGQVLWRAPALSRAANRRCHDGNLARKVVGKVAILVPKDASVLHQSRLLEDGEARFFWFLSRVLACGCRLAEDHLEVGLGGEAGVGSQGVLISLDQVVFDLESRLGAHVMKHSVGFILLGFHFFDEHALTLDVDLLHVRHLLHQIL